MSIVTSRAVLLRAHPYGDTSLILRFLTQDHGMLGAMARGVRKGSSRSGSSLETFADGLLTFHVREGRDLQTFRSFSDTRTRPGLSRSILGLSGASLIAEIVLAHVGEEAGVPLFRGFLASLDAVEGAEDGMRPGWILAGAWSMVTVLGFAPVLEVCVVCGVSLATDEVGRFDAGEGGMRCQRCGSSGSFPRVGPVAREHLRALMAGRPPRELRRPSAHLKLLSDFLHFHLAGSRRLRSLPLLEAQFSSLAERKGEADTDNP